MPCLLRDTYPGEAQFSPIGRVLLLSAGRDTQEGQPLKRNRATMPRNIITGQAQKSSENYEKNVSRIDDKEIPTLRAPTYQAG